MNTQGLKMDWTRRIRFLGVAMVSMLLVASFTLSASARPPEGDARGFLQ